jgi:hypothetical protein
MRKDKQIDVNDPDYDDPILAEIRQIRSEFSERFDGDIDAMSRYFEEQRRLHPIEGMIETVPHRMQSGPSKAQPEPPGRGRVHPDGLIGVTTPTTTTPCFQKGIGTPLEP